ncbi:MAG: hypothetical protein A3K19_30005 [Lentisphaerae bacterium RIFOXYB12_FULL_65_16]|nr:MAG: hypothetical protein A3K18_33615 [Lentisphaerae bacterium RIFOXYA12_64_32]OGV86559.1 MAG: hypothetical protein A3K19_30005 [Lentisphaerae bacterium RIFOXYB12_FULL_65_16]
MPLLVGLLLTLAAPRADEAELRLRESTARRQFMEKLTTAHGDLDRLEADLDADIQAFQALIEEGMVFRERMTAMGRELHEKIRADQPLSGADLDRLNQGIGAGAALMRRIFAVVDIHALWSTLSPRESSDAGFAELPMPLRTKGAMLSLAGSLFLYDTYRLHVAILAEDAKIRRVLNQGDAAYANRKDLLGQVTAEFLSVSNRVRVGEELRFCEINQFATAARYGGEPNLRYLQELIAQSPARELVRHGVAASSQGVLDQAGQRTVMAGDDLRWLGDTSMNSLSLFFGNTVGLVELRKGKLFGDAAVAKLLQQTLRPGDILLEKTPFRLTDTFIPGHWGHAATWVGTETDLRDLGLWDDPVVQPYQAAIRDSRSIVEALRSGVTMNSAEHFLNIDDLAVLRDPAAARDTTRNRVLLALRQVGKAYDFNFDVETPDRIVCSELVYAVFTEFTWPTGRTLGRYTISPDNVAEKALNNGPLQLVLFYHDGQKIEQQPEQLMGQLMATAEPEASSAKRPWKWLPFGGRQGGK